MDTEDFTFNNSANTEKIKHLSTILPWVRITVFAHSLVVEAVHLSDLSGLMVSSEESDMARVLQFQTQEELECLNRIESAVDKISHKYVSSVWDVPSLVE